MIGKSMHRFPALFGALALAGGTIFASGNVNAGRSAPAGGHEQHTMMPRAPTTRTSMPIVSSRSASAAL